MTMVSPFVTSQYTAAENHCNPEKAAGLKKSQKI